MTSNKHWIETDETAQQRIDQARSLKDQAKTGGLKFETYLTPDLAEWVLDMVEEGVFIDPCEAVFVYMGQAKDIEPHDDLKKELLRRRIQEGIDDAEDRRTYTADEVQQHLEEVRRRRTAPAIWKKISHA
jgi:hypothetical protein